MEVPDNDATPRLLTRRAIMKLNGSANEEPCKAIVIAFGKPGICQCRACVQQRVGVLIGQAFCSDAKLAQVAAEDSERAKRLFKRIGHQWFHVRIN